MDIGVVPVVFLIAILLIIAVLYLVLKGFKLPGSYYKNEKKRREIRMRLLEKEYEDKQPKKEQTEEN